MPQINQIFKDRYQLSQLLGENASQQTWLATDLASQSPATVVVKLLAMSPHMQWDEARLLEREAQILQKLNHPQIPSYRDYFMLDQLADSRFPWFCLVQSHVPGHSLQQLLDQGRHFTEAEVEKIAIEVLSLLVYLHDFEPPLLHRDLKPSNLIWGTDDRLYLIDFGSVQDRAALEGATFTVVGTYGYVPMEQFGGQAVPASDLYALGATLIHLLTGIAPADLPHQNARIQFAQQVSIDPALVNWINQLTAPDLADRLSTARLALEALEKRHLLSLPTVNRKPKGSRIQLKKTVNHLEITIPPHGWQAASWLYWLGLVGGTWWVVFVPSVWWFFVIFYAVIFIAILLPAISQTMIRGDRTHFTFYWKLLGFRVWKRCLPTVNLNPDFSIYEQEGWGVKGITIRAGKQALTTNPMAEVERHWVIQEIKDWLSSSQRAILAENATAPVLPDSRVQINESTDELTIRYPGYPNSEESEKSVKYFLMALLVSIILFWLLFAWIPDPLLRGFVSFATSFLAVQTMVGILLHQKRFPILLRFTRDRFVCSLSRLGRTFELFSGSNEEIRELTQDVSQKWKDQGIFIPHLVIRTSNKTYTFGESLTKPERDQIIQAINNWLRRNRREA